MVTGAARECLIAVRAAEYLSEDGLLGGTSIFPDDDHAERRAKIRAIMVEHEKNGLVLWGPHLGYCLTAKGHEALAGPRWPKRRRRAKLRGER